MVDSKNCTDTPEKIQFPRFGPPSGKKKGNEPLPGLVGRQTELERILKPQLPGPKQFIPKDRIHDALANPPITWHGNSTFPGFLEEQFVEFKYPAKGCPEVHMIWTDSPCWITCWNDSNAFIKALSSSKIEFVLAQHPWLENDCLFADIVLPVNTKFEEQDVGHCTEYSGQYNTIFYEEKCIESLGESKSDYEIVCMIAEKLGLGEEYTGGKSIEDMIKIIFEYSGAENMISYEEFKEKAYFVVPTDPDWEKRPAGMKGFCDDPDNHTLKTPSGKIEFYSQGLAKNFPDDAERPPVPHWIEKGESHDERITGERAKKYPLLIISNHGRWRVHAQCDDITWFNETPTGKIKGPDGYSYEPLWMHPVDAAARGIEDGDIIKVYNERGAVLGGAYVSERIMPGSLSMDHGARYDPIVVGELDRGGVINTITPHATTSKKATGMAVSSFLVEVEKVNIDELKKQYPGVFNKANHPANEIRQERACI
jgi:trimethylamine-N-oxide reductase (cytochrome c)